MRNRALIKCFGVALAASLVVLGCDSGGGGAEVADAGGNATVTGGGGSGGISGGGAAGGSGTPTGSAGLSGGSQSGGGAGTSGSGTGGTSGTGTTGTGTSGTGTTGGATGGGAFSNPVGLEDSVTSLNNPTQVVRIGNTVYIVDGFNFGNNGRLLASQVTIANGVPTLGPLTQVAAQAGSPASPTLPNPFGLATDGTDLFISVGFNNFGQGAILKVSNLTASNNTVTGRYEDITDTLTGTAASGNTTRPVSPAFMLIANVNGAEYIYWSEYSQENSSGGIRRIRTAPSDTETADTIVNGLNFPAGIATDGSNLIIADSGGGQASLGQVVKVPLSFTSGSAPLTPASPGATVIGVSSGDQAISRPFGVVYDGSTGFFFTEGNAIETSGLGATGQSNGTVRYLPRSANTATVVVDSVTNGAGIDVATLGNGQVGVLYSESIALNGRVMRAVVNTGAPAAVAPSVVDTGLNRPLDVVINSPSVPVFSAVVNYNGGQANGLLNIYSPQ